LRLKLLDSQAEQRLGGQASRAPRPPIKPIDGMRARIDQITTGALKSSQEAFIVDGGIDGVKSIPDGPIQTRVAVVEEPAGRGRSLSDKEQPHGSGTIAPPKPFEIASTWHPENPALP